MNRSANKFDDDWKREWDEEQKLTLAEQKKLDKDKAEEDQIYADYIACLVEAERQEDDAKFKLEQWEEQWEENAKKKMEEDDDPAVRWRKTEAR